MPTIMILVTIGKRRKKYSPTIWAPQNEADSDGSRNMVKYSTRSISGEVVYSSYNL